MEREESRNLTPREPPDSGSWDGDTCREIRPANIYDTAANESWLEDRAARGWYLTDMSGWRASFRRGEPGAVRYRMQPVGKKAEQPTEEMRDLYGAMGWEYVCTLQDLFHIWRCEDPKAPELDTDPVVQELGYGYLKRRMVWDCGISVLLLAALLTLWVWMPGITDTPLLDMVRECVPGQILAGAGVCAFWLVQVACQIRSMIRLLGRLRAGIPQERPRPYRRQLWLARILLACAIFVVSARLVGGFRNMSGSSLSGGWDAGDSCHDPDSGVVYVDLAGLEGAARTEIWSCRTKFSELCPRMYETRQLALGPEEEDLQPGGSLPVTAAAETAYYRMLTESQAAAIAEELAQRQIASFRVDGHPTLAAVSPAPAGLDGFWWGEDTYYQYAVARLGRQVLFLSYQGETDLRERGAYFASLLTG